MPEANEQDAKHVLEVVCAGGHNMVTIGQLCLRRSIRPYRLLIVIPSGSWINSGCGYAGTSRLYNTLDAISGALRGSISVCP